MDLADAIKLFAQYGLGGIFAGIIGWVLYKVGLRLIDAIDRLIAKVDALGTRLDDKIAEHTRVDVEHHNEVKQAIAESHGVVHEEIIGLRSRIDTVMELTPVEGHRRQTPPHGAPQGYYSPSRPKTQGGGR